MRGGVTKREKGTDKVDKVILETAEEKVRLSYAETEDTKPPGEGEVLHFSQLAGREL